MSLLGIIIPFCRKFNLSRKDRDYPIFVIFKNFILNIHPNSVKLSEM